MLCQNIYVDVFHISDWCLPRMSDWMQTQWISYTVVFVRSSEDKHSLHSRYANTRKYKIIPSHPPPSVMLSFKKWECTYSPNVHGMKVWWQYNDVLRHLQDVHDHPQGPNVTRLVVLLGAKNLRGCGKRGYLWCFFFFSFCHPSFLEHRT